MFKNLLLLAVMQGLTATLAYADENYCLLADRQQQNLILSEAPKALRKEGTTECFNRLVRDELAVLKEGDSPLANDRISVIHSLMHAALERDSFDKTQAE